MSDKTEDRDEHTLTEVDVVEAIVHALDAEIEQTGSVMDRLNAVEQLSEYDPGTFTVVDRDGRRWAIEVREV